MAINEQHNDGWIQTNTVFISAFKEVNFYYIGVWNIICCKLKSEFLSTQIILEKSQNHTPLVQKENGTPYNTLMKKPTTK